MRSFNLEPNFSSVPSSTDYSQFAPTTLEISISTPSMGRRKNKQRAEKAKSPSSITLSNTGQSPAILKTTTAIASDPILGFKLRVLLYDFLNVTKDPNAERRINNTTDEHYISLPYFSQAEVSLVKSAIVDADLSRSAALPGDAHEDGERMGNESINLAIQGLGGKSFGEVVRALLTSFFDKRRASGDTRPCGPHHLAPLYALLFGVNLREMQDENFLGRLRRSGA
jgi:hypothetical protein